MTIIYAATPENPLTTTQRIRNTRLHLLKSCDWTVVVDSPLSESKKAEWIIYRQELRDLPSLYSDDDDFSNVNFPTEPN